jgi:hypothetical protein
MIAFIKYRLELRKLEKESSRIQKTYVAHRKGLSGAELEQLNAEEGSEILPVLDEIDALTTRRFRQIANRLMVPLPDYEDKQLWQDRYYRRGKNLTSKGIWELKKLIRQEKRERREGFVVLLATLTGIIGAITGLLAVLSQYGNE